MLKYVRELKQIWSREYAEWVTDVVIYYLLIHIHTLLSGVVPLGQNIIIIRTVMRLLCKLWNNAAWMLSTSYALIIFPFTCVLLSWLSPCKSCNTFYCIFICYIDFLSYTCAQATAQWCAYDNSVCTFEFIVSLKSVISVTCLLKTFPSSCNLLVWILLLHVKWLKMPLQCWRWRCHNNRVHLYFSDFGCSPSDNVVCRTVVKFLTSFKKLS